MIAKAASRKVLSQLKVFMHGTWLVKLSENKNIFMSFHNAIMINVRRVLLRENNNSRDTFRFNDLVCVSTSWAGE